jgi:ferric-dicitrate binding protein FerR (iron transport regulator)
MRDVPPSPQDLVRAWCTGEIAEADHARLEAALRVPELARDFLRELHLDQAIGRVARAQVERQALAEAAPASERMKRRRARPMRLARVNAVSGWAAVLCIAVALGAAWQHFSPAPVVATLVAAAGDAHVDDAVIRAGDSCDVRDGDRLDLPSKGWASLCYPDGTVVNVLGEARLVIGLDHGAKHLTVEQGEVRADVRKQPVGQPLVISTPRADTTVVGTRLIVMGGSHERVAVEEGRVRVERRRDHATVQVGAGEQVEIALTAPLAVIHPQRPQEVDETPQVAGLQLWLDADRGISCDHDGLVWQWRDQGPLGLDLSQAETDLQPRLLTAAAGTHAAVSFDPHQDWLSCPGRWPEFHAYTVAMVIRPTALGAWSQTLGCSWGSFTFHGDGQGGIFAGVGAMGGGIRFTPSQLPPGSLRLNRWRRYAITYADGVGSAYIDGHLMGRMDMPRPQAWSRFHIGRPHAPADEPYGFGGDLQEVLVYDRALDADAIDRLDRRFRRRLGEAP